MFYNLNKNLEVLTLEDNNYIWNSTVEEIVLGYKEQKDAFYCIFCNMKYQKGHIYTINNKLYDAFGAVNKHHTSEHESTADYLLCQKSNLIGISDMQQQILKLMLEGKDDKTISKIAGIAASTVRNHRFKLREKEKQAKIFLALMQSLENKTKRSIRQADTGTIEEIHPSANMIDDRYNITDQDRSKTISSYINEYGSLSQFPAKEKKKIIILREIMKNFKQHYTYNEGEVNEILQRIYGDYPTIRRALIEYGFMERSADCSEYRVKS